MSGFGELTPEGVPSTFGRDGHVLSDRTSKNRFNNLCSTSNTSIIIRTSITPITFSPKSRTDASPSSSDVLLDTDWVLSTSKRWCQNPRSDYRAASKTTLRVFEVVRSVTWEWTQLRRNFFTASCRNRPKIRSTSYICAWVLSTSCGWSEMTIWRPYLVPRCPGVWRNALLASMLSYHGRLTGDWCGSETVNRVEVTVWRYDAVELRDAPLHLERAEKSCSADKLDKESAISTSSRSSLNTFISYIVFIVHKT